MPPEERALLAAIIADPDDDTARLAYADWLDEHADELPPARRAPARAKAELIRNQIASGGLVFGTPDFKAKYDALQARRWVLLTEENRAAWEAELEGVTPARGLQFDCVRGLFGEVACSARYFVEEGAALFDAAPVTSVYLTNFAASNVKSLAACPHFARVRALRLEYRVTAHDAIFALLDRAPLSHLRGLVVFNWLIDAASGASLAQADPVAARAADCAKLCHLKRLSFRAAGVGDAGGRALAESPHLANLELLDLRTNPGLGNAAKALRNRFGSRVWIADEDVKGFPVGYHDGE